MGWLVIFFLIIPPGRERSLLVWEEGDGEVGGRVLGGRRGWVCRARDNLPDVEVVWMVYYI